MTALLSQNGYNFERVGRWIDEDMFIKKKKIILPINLGNSHWATAVISIEEQTIKYLDSSHQNRGNRYLDALLKFVHDSWKKLNNGRNLPDSDKWILIGHTSDIPQQTNGYDCGVFCIMFAEHNAMNLALHFSQRDIPNTRQRITRMIQETTNITI